MRKFEELDGLEVLALAIAVEEANGERFRTLADLYQEFDRSLEELFRSLGDEEGRHAGWLQEEWERRFKNAPRPKLTEEMIAGVIEAVDLEHGEHAIFDDLDRKGALRLVARSEAAAERFYKSAAASCADPGLKALYLDLAAMEAKHLGALEELAGEDDRVRKTSQ